MGKVLKIQTPNHFGDCPKCKKNDGHLNVGRDHWFHCRKHQVKWYVGNNIFPDWMDETYENWKRNESLLECYLEVEPLQQWQFTVDENEFFRLRRQKKLEIVGKPE